MDRGALHPAIRMMDRSRRFPEARALYEQAVDVESLAEEMYRQLMVCLSA